MALLIETQDQAAELQFDSLLSQIEDKAFDMNADEIKAFEFKFNELMVTF